MGSCYTVASHPSHLPEHREHQRVSEGKEMVVDAESPVRPRDEQQLRASGRGGGVRGGRARRRRGEAGVYIVEG